jgi:hypothetical protein
VVETADLMAVSANQAVALTVQVLKVHAVLTEMVQPIHTAAQELLAAVLAQVVVLAAITKSSFLFFDTCIILDAFEHCQ